MARVNHWGRRAFVAALVASPMLGCGKIKRLFEGDRSGPEAKLAAIEKVGRDAKATPPLTEDTLDVDGPAPDFGLRLDGAQANARVIDVQDFDDLTSDTTKRRLAYENPFRDVANWLRKDGPKPHGNTDVTQLMDLRYVLVMRTIRLVEPQIEGEGTGKFIPGTWEGEALLFDLDRGARVGGFRFVGEMTEEVEIQGSGNALATNEKLFDSLQDSTLFVVNETFKAKFPGKAAPFRR